MKDKKRFVVIGMTVVLLLFIVIGMAQCVGNKVQGVADTKTKELMKAISEGAADVEKRDYAYYVTYGCDTSLLLTRINEKYDGTRWSEYEIPIGTKIKENNIVGEAWYVDETIHKNVIDLSSDEAKGNFAFYPTKITKKTKCIVFVYTFEDGETVWDTIDVKIK